MQRRRWFEIATGTAVAVTVPGCSPRSGGAQSAATAAENWLAGLAAGRLAGGADTRDLTLGAPLERHQRVAEFLSDQQGAPFASLWAEGNSLQARDQESRAQFAFELRFAA